MKRLPVVLVVLAVGLSFGGLVWAAAADTARFASWPEAFNMANGSLVHRFTATPDNTSAESNLTASGGTALAYTLFGGERICLQAITTDAYVEIVASASMTAAGAKGWTLVAGQSPFANCFTLRPGETSVSLLCTAAGPCLVKGYEQR